MDIMYMQLQYNGPKYDVPKDEPIIFDHFLEHNEDIEYDLLDGRITFKRKGVYIIQWGASIVSGGGNFSAFKVKLNDNVEIKARSSLVGSELVGFAIVDVTTLPRWFYLVADTFTSTLQGGEGTANISIFGVSKKPEKFMMSFASGFASNDTIAMEATGILTKTRIIGTGVIQPIQECFEVIDGTEIRMPFQVEHAQFIYSFPYDVRVVGASVIFNNYTTIRFNKSTTNVSPYVAIALRTDDKLFAENIFMLQESTRVYPEEGYRNGYNVPTTLTANTESLDLLIPAGTLFAIFGGFISLGTSTEAIEAKLFIRGNMFFEIVESQEESI